MYVLFICEYKSILIEIKMCFAFLVFWWLVERHIHDCIFFKCIETHLVKEICYLFLGFRFSKNPIKHFVVIWLRKCAVRLDIMIQKVDITTGEF